MPHFHVFRAQLVHGGLVSAMLLLAVLASAGRSVAESPAYVCVSPRDSHYFELSDGRPYVPIGLNLATSRAGAGLSTPQAAELPDYEHWFRRLSENGGNYARVWLGGSTFDVEHAQSGHYDAAQAQRIGLLLDLARRHGIRLKLCLDFFRHVGDASSPNFGKPLHHVSHGGPAANTADFFNSARCREQYKCKLAWFRDRYGDNPTVFGWELWNEMNCIADGDWAGWSEIMLAELHRLFPRNLAMQSLGSFDHPSHRDGVYRRLCTMPGNDVLQVHRYLDTGARLEICHGPVDLLVVDAVRQIMAFDVPKPILLAETGAVEPRHSGAFKLYQKDRAGMILHDALFGPFFAGAAGPGHVWHWDIYVDRMNLWHHFARFARAIEGIDPAAEQFQPVTLPHDRLRVLCLRGKTMLLAWCRDTRNTWQTELAQGQSPQRIQGARIDLADVLTGTPPRSASAYDPWNNDHTDLRLEGSCVCLPEFSRSLVIKVIFPTNP